MLNADENLINMENGLVEDIFTHPKSKAARRLVIEGKDPEEWEEEQDSGIPELNGTRKIRIVFSSNSSYEPVIANMVLAFSSPVNILYADTKDVNGVARGEMVLGLSENNEVALKQISYLKDRGLEVEEV